MAPSVRSNLQLLLFANTHQLTDYSQQTAEPNERSLVPFPETSKTPAQKLNGFFCTILPLSPNWS